MFYTTVLSLFFLFTARARVQVPFGTRPSDWRSTDPYKAFSKRPHGSDRISDKSSYIEQAIKNAMSVLGDYGLTFSTGNGATTVTAMIAGKRYSTTFAEDATIYTNTFIKKTKERFSQQLQITVNDETYSYMTTDGRTTVIDGKGRKLKNGGPFGPITHGRPLGSNELSDINGLVEHARKNAMSLLGDYGTTISTANGTTTVTAMIVGKRYTATFPKDDKIYTKTFIKRQKGSFYEVFEITANGDRYTYETVNGKTTVFDREGRDLKNGGPFKIVFTPRA